MKEDTVIINTKHCSYNSIIMIYYKKNHQYEDIEKFLNNRRILLIQVNITNPRINITYPRANITNSSQYY